MSSDATRPPHDRRLLPGLTRANLLRELSAGVTLIAISVPLNIGYAQIAGLPATAGLYALVVPALVFALTASSRQVVVAPDAAAAALVASSLAGVGLADAGSYSAMAAAQALIGGVVFLLCSRLRLGFLADFLSRPILVGFIGGLALEVSLSQVAKMLGIGLPEGEFLDQATHLLTSLGQTHGWTVAVSAIALALLLGGRRWAPSVPWALVVMVLATAATSVLDLTDRGVAVLGSMPSGLPELAFPDLSLEVWLGLVPSAVALTAVTVAEGLMVARSYADHNGYPTDPDRDLAAFGLANVAAGLTSSFTVGSSTSRTAAMDEAGSRTQLPAVVLAVGSVLLLLFGADLLADIPAPAIGATVAVAVSRLLGLAELRHLRRVSPDELVVALVAFVGVLAIGPIGGLVVAFALAVVNLTRRAAAPHVHLLADPRRPESAALDLGEHVTQTAPGALVLRLAGPVFFANADALGAEVVRLVREAPDPVRVVILDVGSVTDVDTTAAEALERLEKELRAEGATIAITREDDRLLRRLERLGVLEAAERFPTNRAALASYELRAGAGE